MGKRIIQQARGHGSGTYRVRRKAFRIKTKYPPVLSGEGTVVNLLNSPGHSAPLAKIRYSSEKGGGVFFMPAFRGMLQGQKISFEGKEIKEGNVVQIGNIPIKTNIYNLEANPRDGGIFIKTAGSHGTVNRIMGDDVYVLMPSKKEIKLNKKCRATIGLVAGAGRLDKPVLKAGKKYHIKKSKGKLWPRTSAVKMNAIDHPFGSGRGKNPKSKIAKRNAPPGRKVGHLRPRQTGKRK